MSDIVERLRIDWMDSEFNEVSDEAIVEIESLRQQLAAANAEIARLGSTPPEKREDLRCVISDLCDQVRERDNQLAASQAREQQLREGLHYSLGAWHYDGVSDEHGSIFQEANNRCDQPADTSALEAMIAKAGEVMRGRTLACFFPFGIKADDKIRALPGVTLEDLK